jgi:hypothetical protein
MIDKSFFDAAAQRVFELIAGSSRPPGKDEIARAIEEAWLEIP